MNFLGNRLKWVFANCLSMALAYALAGGVVGAGIGFFNWAQPMNAHPWWYWVGFTFAANAVWSVIFGLTVTLPLFFLLSTLIPAPREADNLKARRSEVWWFMIVPAALLQSLGALGAGAIFVAIPGARPWLQLVAPGRDGGGVLGSAQYELLLLGSCVGALILGLIWHFSQSEAKSHGSRLLPLD